MKIRKKTEILHFVILAILIIYALFRLNFSDEAHKIGVEIFVSCLAIFGILVKSILNFLFPQIILDNNGIKIFGREKIYWKEIKNITVIEENQNVKIIIEKLNSVKIISKFKNLQLSYSQLNNCIQKFRFN